MNKVIAVDYDDTITEHRPYPEKAPLNKTAKIYLDLLNDLGYKLVLWTARSGNDYKEAYDRCINEFGLTYLIEDNPNLEHGHTGKLCADYYIDDKSSFGNIDWQKTFEYIIKHIV